TDCVHPGTGFNRSALSHHLRISANAPQPRSPNRRSTISNDDQFSLAMDHIASSGIGIATGKLIAFRCALMIGACLRIVQFLSWKLPFAEAEVSVLPPFLLSTFRQCENHPRASAKLMFASIRPISLSGAPMKLHILALRLERQPRRNFPAFLQRDSFC